MQQMTSIMLIMNIKEKMNGVSIIPKWNLNFPKLEKHVL